MLEAVAAELRGEPFEQLIAVRRSVLRERPRSDLLLTVMLPELLVSVHSRESLLLTNPRKVDLRPEPADRHLRWPLDDMLATLMVIDRLHANPAKLRHIRAAQ